MDISLDREPKEIAAGGVAMPETVYGNLRRRARVRRSSCPRTNTTHRRARRQSLPLDRSYLTDTIAPGRLFWLAANRGSDPVRNTNPISLMGEAVIEAVLGDVLQVRVFTDEDGSPGGPPPTYPVNLTGTTENNWVAFER